MQNSPLTVWHWGCLILLVGGIGILFVAIGWLLSRQPPLPEGPFPTAEIWTATPTPSPTATPRPVPSTPPATGPDAFRTGMRVRVTGTGEIGLNLREAPGLTSDRVAIAAEGELFIVAGGPVEVDDLTWWLLKDEANPQREGWAAGSYLQAE